MKLYRPLHVCAYLFGVFPAVAICARDSGRERFRVHWPGIVLKVFLTLFYWILTGFLSVMYIRSFLRNQKITKVVFTQRVLDIDELFVYVLALRITTTSLCQVHLLWPSVVQVINECFFDLCRLDDVTGAWQYFTAFTIVLHVIYEFAMYLYLTNYKFTSGLSKLVCFFPMVSNITCIVVEQFFYLLCISLYLRLRVLHMDIKKLVHKAEHPRWKCWVTPAAGGPTRLGIPAFSASDIRDQRAVHLACMELFTRINRLFQLPLTFCLIDIMFNLVIFLYGIAFDVTTVIWEKKIHIDYVNTIMWSGICVTRIIRFLQLHMCEHYVTKKIIPIRSSLSWLSLVLNPISSRRLMPEIILFQHQLDTIKSKFYIFGVINIKMTLLYAGIGSVLAFIILLLQFFAFNQISMRNISTELNNGTNTVR